MYTFFVAVGGCRPKSSKAIVHRLSIFTIVAIVDFSYEQTPTNFLSENIFQRQKIFYVETNETYKGGI
jgi:hypothetical protein